MDNIELEKKVFEIVNIENFFDMVIAAKGFEKEYKTSDFYKTTKMPLDTMIKEAKIYYALQLRDITTKFQTFINTLDLTNVNGVLNQLGDTFSKENEETLSLLKDIKELTK